MVYVNLLYKFSFLTISLLDTAKRILYNSCVIRENKAVKSMKAKTVLILLSAVILCLTGCTESQKPTTVVDNSSAVTTSSNADSESGNDKYYDSTPISQAYLSGNTANLDDKQLEIYNKAVSAIEKLITLDMNDYEKELAVHDYIVGCASYDETHLNALGIGLPNSDNPYCCLINGKAICSGYSTTFQLFMDMLEIPCKTIYATDFEGDDHSWNIVQIGGSWYYVDACWDDPIPDFTDRPVRHKYFNVSKEYMKTKHVWDDTELPDTDSTKFSYITQTVTHINSVNEIESLMEKALDNMQDSVAVTSDMSDFQFSETDQIDTNFNEENIKGLSKVFDSFCEKHTDHQVYCQRVQNGNDIVLVIYMRKFR